MTEERYFGAQCASCGANMAHNPCCGRAEVLAARLDEARARAEKLAAALRFYADCHEEDRCGYDDGECNCVAQPAARALADAKE